MHILFVMYDQLRYDHLSCAGHPHLQTPDFDRLAASGEIEDTMIVPSSDHGDFLGDDWLGEKDMFHDPTVKVPLIVYDSRAEADATRGTDCDALVESIDLAPTFVETDPESFNDLAHDTAHASRVDPRCRMMAHRSRRMSQRVTRSDGDIRAMRGNCRRREILPFLKDGNKVPKEWTVKYAGVAPTNYTPIGMAPRTHRHKQGEEHEHL